MPRRRGRSVRSRRYKQMRANIDNMKMYTVAEAVEALRANRFKAKFDESVELVLKLDIDTTQSEQQLRGSFSLPHGTGKTMRVIAFCEGETAAQALASGAVKAGGEELVNEILKENWMDFDVAVAHPSMMRFVGRLGKALGPKGLMPSPKSGTVTPNVADAVREFKAGKLEFRHDKNGVIQVAVGKLSFDGQKLAENVESFINHILSLRPSAVRGRFLAKIILTSTMGPGLKIEYAPAAV